MERQASVPRPKGGGPFASVFQSAAIGMTLMDPSGRLLAVNPALLDLLGYAEAELVGKSCEQLSHASDAAPLEAGFAALRSGERTHFVLEKRCRRKDGGTVWGRLTVSVSGPDRSVFVGMIEDVTDRRRADRRHAIRLAVTQQLAEAPTADEALRGILEAVCRSLEWDYGELWMVEPDSERLEHWMSWHEAPDLKPFAAAGCSYSFGPGEGLPGRVWIERRPTWLHDVRREPRLPRRALLEAHGLRGAIAFPIVSGSELLGVMAFFGRHFEEPDPDLLAMMADVGSQLDQYLMRRRAEEKLLQLGTVLASTDDAVLTLSADGTFLGWNEAFESIYGFSPAELRGGSYLIVVPPERHAQSLELLARVRGGERIEHLETTWRRRDGRLLDVSLTVAPIRAASGTVCCLTAVVRDISARKQAERYKDEFLSVLSHELKTPLNFIMGFASILADDPGLDPEQRSSVRHIQEGADRLYRMIRNLLCLSDVLAGRFGVSPEYTPIDVLVNEAMLAMRAMADQKGVRIETDLATCEVYVDGNKAIQLLTILLENALKFTPEGGQVAITAALEQGGLSLRVRDTGIGIAPEDQPRLFTRLLQLDMSSTRKAGGLGVGLSIAKAIAEAHGGTIGVESRPGEGSTFWVRLPQPA